MKNPLLLCSLGLVIASTTFASPYSDGDSNASVISNDGRWIAFESDASNLIPGNVNSRQQIYLRDQKTGVLKRVTNQLDGKAADEYCYLEGMSADGRYILFSSSARGLVDLPDTPPHDPAYWNDGYVYDRNTGKIEVVTITPDGSRNRSMAYPMAISADGRFVLLYSWYNWDGGTVGFSKVYVRDRVLGKTEQVSFPANQQMIFGDAIANSISADGRYVVYSSKAWNVVPNDENDSFDVFLYDRQLQKTYLVSKTADGQAGNGHSIAGLISPDGKYISYFTFATNLVDGDSNENIDVAIFDMETQKTTGILTSVGGVGGGWPFQAKHMAFGGSKIFFSFCQDLAINDANKTCDLYSYDLVNNTSKLESLGPNGIQGNSEWGPALFSVSPDGKFMTFAIDSTNFMPGDTAANFEVYLRDLETGAFDLVSKPEQTPVPVQFIDGGMPVLSAILHPNK